MKNYFKPKIEPGGGGGKLGQITRKWAFISRSNTMSNSGQVFRYSSIQVYRSKIGFSIRDLCLIDFNIISSSADLLSTVL